MDDRVKECLNDLEATIDSDMPPRIELMISRLRRAIRNSKTILCNKCGQSCKHKGVNYGLLDQIIYGEYDSPALSDMTQYTFSLCEHCLLKLFQDFKIPVSESEDFEL